MKTVITESLSMRDVLAHHYNVDNLLLAKKDSLRFMTGPKGARKQTKRNVVLVQFVDSPDNEFIEIVPCQECDTVENIMYFLWDNMECADYTYTETRGKIFINDIIF